MGMEEEEVDSVEDVDAGTSNSLNWRSSLEDSTQRPSGEKPTPLK
jgi:hypothetical protein